MTQLGYALLQLAYYKLVGLLALISTRPYMKYTV
jgi:hypothetical protein